MVKRSYEVNQFALQHFSADNVDENMQFRNSSALRDFIEQLIYYDNNLWNPIDAIFQLTSSDSKVVELAEKRKTESVESARSTDCWSMNVVVNRLSAGGTVIYMKMAVDHKAL